MTQADILQSVLRRKVRAVICERTPAADAIFDIAALGRDHWSVPEWVALLQSLDRCDLSVADWLLTQ